MQIIIGMDSIINILGFYRRPTRKVYVGSVPMGSDYPIRVQTMTTTNTNNIDETVEQSIKAIERGADFIRITSQGKKEAQSIGKIKQILEAKGYTTPIIADIHFNPVAALEAAKYVDKIRINPGNYADKSRSSDIDFTDLEYEQELKRVEERFIPLIDLCKQNGVAIRIGVNHGSLSQRIMCRYGDTPEGMAHSAMEFLRICRRHDFHNLVVSMKSSNTRVMVQSTRQLAVFMEAEGMDYPLHLGVTEAGEGDDGRIKSAVGIGALLVDGIGDTIRVSLTEEPEVEIPVAKTLVSFFKKLQGSVSNNRPSSVPINPFEYKRRESFTVLGIGGDNPPVVLADMTQNSADIPLTVEEYGWKYDFVDKRWIPSQGSPEFIFIGDTRYEGIPVMGNLPVVGSGDGCSIAYVEADDLLSQGNKLSDDPFFLAVRVGDIKEKLIEKLAKEKNAIILLHATPNIFHSVRNAIFQLMERGIANPIVLSLNIDSKNVDEFKLMASAIAGPLFIDGLCDGIMLSCTTPIRWDILNETSFGILQASRARITKTEFISCPGCGRTLFDLYETLRLVKERISHLKGLKIAVMGCIVNGPGEMADADYGYVGAGPGLVSLYRKKELVKKNIPQSQAVEELVKLIKSCGDWSDA